MYSPSQPPSLLKQRGRSKSIITHCICLTIDATMDATMDIGFGRLGRLNFHKAADWSDAFEASREKSPKVIP